ncbi:MAG: type II toxin-antitoxin system PemK/MazF family toxin [Caulobacteraceae bacterium]
MRGWRTGNLPCKPRPVVIVQDDRLAATASVTICAVTSDETQAPLFRIPVQPDERNGLRSPFRLMVDKLTRPGSTASSSKAARSPGPAGSTGAQKPCARTWRRRAPGAWRGRTPDRRYSAFTMPSTIFLASPKSIMVLSRKKSSFSTPA